MKPVYRSTLILSALFILLAACSTDPVMQPSDREGKLVINHDGSMELDQRPLPVKDVIIYDDGFGGEKAAIKMYVPLHPPFYRDSILVERKSIVDPDTSITD